MTETATTQYQIGEHHNVPIYVGTRGVFTAAVGDITATAPQISTLRDKIDAVRQAQAKSRKLALSVIAAYGGAYRGYTRGLVTGLSLKDGSPAGMDIGTLGTAYPSVPWIANQLDRIHDLRRQASALEETLRPYKLSELAARYKVNAGNHVARLDLVEEEYHRVHAAAVMATPEASDHA